MNFQAICRVCATENPRMLSIFESYNFSKHNCEIFKAIADCASVQIQKFDGFSEQICRRCLDHLSQAYSFKRLCEDSDYKFRNNLVGSETIYIKNEQHVEIKTENECNKDPFLIEEEELNSTNLSSDVSESIEYQESSELNNSHCIENDGDSKLSHKSGLSEKRLALQLRTDQPAEACKDDKLDVDLITSEEIEFKSESSSNMFSDNHSDIKEDTGVIGLNQVEEEADENQVSIDSSNRQFKCGLCDKSYSAKPNLIHHLRAHAGQKPFKCDVCNKTFTRSYILTNHMRSHTGDYKYKCGLCDKKFLTNSNLKLHSVLHTGEKRYKCDVCNKEFAYKGTLVAHKKSHTGEKQYKCEICETFFLMKSSLNRHTRLHMGEKHVCYICSKTYSSKSHLINHIRVHTGRAQYKCDICDKKIASSSSLKRHIALHTGEKKYKCHVCDKAFVANNYLRQHIKSHTEEKRHECDVCDKKYTTKKSLMKHIRLHLH